MPVARSHIEGNAEELVKWTKDVQYEPVFNLGNTMMESFARLNQVERLCKKLPGLDCGSCGSPSCRALAEDVVLGHAVELDCIFKLKQKIQQMSKQMVDIAEMTRK